MLQKDNRYRILRVFFDDPLPKEGGFQLREMSRKVGVAPPSVKRYLAELEKASLIVKKSHRIFRYPTYYANRDNDYFKLLKKQDMVMRINESGLLDYLSEMCMPDAIVLFGSSSRGEDLRESDIDIFLQCKEVKLHFAKYEKELCRRVNPLFGELHELSKELRNNLLNGIILKGYLKVF